METWKKTWKTLEFNNLGIKNMEKPGIREILKKPRILTFLVVEFRFDTKHLSYKKVFFVIINKLLY